MAAQFKRSEHEFRFSSHFNSLGVKLNLLFVAIVTVVLIFAGLMNIRGHQQRIEYEAKQTIVSLKARLPVSITKALWDLQNDTVADALRSEMIDDNLVTIFATSQNNFVAGYTRGKDGKVQELKETPPQADKMKNFVLEYEANGKKKPIGKVIFEFSDQHAREDLNRAIWGVVAQIVAINVILVLSLYWALRKFVIAPLATTQRALSQIAQGDADLTRRLDESRSDEIGDMARGFNTFTAGLRDIMAQVQQSANKLTAAAEHTNQISDKTNRAVQQQKVETGQVAQTMNGLASQIDAVADNARSAAQTTHLVDERAQHGLNVVKDAMSAMDNLKQEMEKGNQVIQSLASDAEEIGKVVVVIQEITQQTNLLALNAAIEAARAGEEGRGFAVVADEVRKLATRTQSATENIQSMIQRLQDSVHSAVLTVEQSKSLAQMGVVQTNEAGKRISEVSASIRDISEMNSNISTAANLQNSAVVETSRSINNLNHLVDETAGGAAETSHASEQLKNLAAELKSLVERFKV